MTLRVKEKLARGEIATMILVNYVSPALVEKVGQLGFDVAFIDTEKGSASPGQIEEMCRGARAAGIAAVVRPWTGDAGLISRYLDLGADGVMVAAIDTAAAARDLVEAVRYSRFKDYADKLVIGMIESPQAVDNLPALLAVEGIDVWFVGPNDMAHRMGHPGNASHPEVRRMVCRALGAIRAGGRIAGTLSMPETTNEVIAAGATLVMTRVADLLAMGAAAFGKRLADAPAVVAARAEGKSA